MGSNAISSVKRGPARIQASGASSFLLDIVIEQATLVMEEIMGYRRMAAPREHRCGPNCPHCLAPHMENLAAAILKNEPVKFVLPAFPGKSPNLQKVLGVLPDRAEVLALEFLNSLCEKIQKVYQPGAHIILCSDGRVFSDVVGMEEESVTAYQDEIDNIIKERQLTHLSTFNLDEFCMGENFEEVRADLMAQYGQGLETLRNKVRQGGKESATIEEVEAHRMFCGITRFLFEDSLVPGETKSRTRLQKESRTRAYEVIRRSNAWSGLIADQFPNAVRLSIHPQGCGSKKLGIQLLDTSQWMTPWHGVAVETKQGIQLMKHWEAKALNAELILDKKGRPSHFKNRVEKSYLVEEELQNVI